MATAKKDLDRAEPAVADDVASDDAASDDAASDDAASDDAASDDGADERAAASPQARASEAEDHGSFAAKPLWDPYLAGIALGLVLLATFLVFGRGLGASGALARFTGLATSWVAPDWVSHNGHLGGYFAEGSHWWDDWLVFELVGVALGGLYAGLTSGRMKVQVEGGPRIGARTRLVFALIGGAIVGFGARLAMGCTSGQALTGGATLALGSWAFMMAVFGGAYGIAYFVRRLWT